MHTEYQLPICFLSVWCNLLKLPIFFQIKLTNTIHPFFAFGCVFLPTMRLFFTSCSILPPLDLCLSLFSALEENMFRFSDPNSPSSRPQLFLRAQEKVFIPFKFQCLQEPTQQVRKPTISKKKVIKRKFSGLSDGFVKKEEEIQNWFLGSPEFWRRSRSSFLCFL